MKLTAFFVSFLVAVSAQAWGGSCASKVSEIKNISSITTLIDPFGQWETVVNNKKVSVNLAKDKSGNFRIQANFDGQNYGPMGTTLCDYGDGLSFKVLFFEIEFAILSSKSIRIFWEFEGQDSVVLNKKTIRFYEI